MANLNVSLDSDTDAETPTQRGDTMPHKDRNPAEELTRIERNARDVVKQSDLDDISPPGLVGRLTARHTLAEETSLSDAFAAINRAKQAEPKAERDNTSV